MSEKEVFTVFQYYLFKRCGRKNIDQIECTYKVTIGTRFIQRSFYFNLFRKRWRDSKTDEMRIQPIEDFWC